MPCWDHKKASAQSAEAFFVAPRGLPTIRGSAPNTPGLWPRRRSAVEGLACLRIRGGLICGPRGLPTIRGSAPNTPGILPRRSPPPIPSVHPLVQPWHPTWHAHLEQSLASSTPPFQVLSKCFHLAHLSTLHDRQCH